MAGPITVDLTKHATPQASRPQALYRFWNSNDVLLYVGRTANPGKRWRDHARDKEWWADVVRVTVEHFPDLATVDAAERAAIQTECPLYNIVHLLRLAQAATVAPDRHLGPLALTPENEALVAAVHAAITEVYAAIEGVGAAIDNMDGQLEGFDWAARTGKTLTGLRATLSAQAEDMKARAATRIWAADELSLAELGRRLGISKARADQLVRHARGLSGPSR